MIRAFAAALLGFSRTTWVVWSPNQHSKDMCFIASLLQFCLFLDDNIYCCAWKLWSGLLNGTCHAWPSPHKWRPDETSQHPSRSISHKRAREEKHRCWHSSSPMLVPNNTLLSIDEKYKKPRLYQPHPRSKVVGLHLASCHLWRAVNNPWHCIQRISPESQESPFSISSVDQVDPISLPFANITKPQDINSLKRSWKVKHSFELGQSHKGTRQASRQAFHKSTTFRSAKLEPSTFQNTESKWKQTIYASQTWSLNTSKTQLACRWVQCSSKENTKYIQRYKHKYTCDFSFHHSVSPGSGQQSDGILASMRWHLIKISESVPTTDWFNPLPASNSQTAPRPRAAEAKAGINTARATGDALLLHVCPSPAV